MEKEGWNKHTHEHHYHSKESCGCGHEHHHSEGTCGCGHEHHHSEGTCGCGHEHHQEETESETHEYDHADKQIYLLENLGCAHCASQMEEKICALPQVEFASITFATGQLQVVTNTEEELLETFQKICASIEEEVIVKKRSEKAIGKQEIKKGRFSENKVDLWEIGLGAALFFLGLATQEFNGWISFLALIAGYLILGKDVLLTAGKNIGKGRVFDENFLMGVATVAAIVIGDYKEAVGVMLFYRVGELFEEIAVARSRNQIMEAVDLRPEVVNRIAEDGSVHEIAAGDAKSGDILLVRAGDRIPMDGVILEGESRLDTSPVTGESVPVSVESGSSVTSGCVNLSGVLKMRVEKVLEDSMVTRILNSVENAAASKPKIDRFITRFSRIYTPFVVALALATAIIPSIVTGDWNYWVYTAITFLVISCPCALVLSVPLAFFSGIGAGSKRGILFKGGVAIEALQNIKAVVMDKTGTVTKGNFVVQEIISAGEYDEEELLRIAAACEAMSSHPIAVSITAAAGEENLSVEQPGQVEEISGNGIAAELTEGTILCGNRRLLEQHQVDLSSYQPKSYGTEVLLAVNGVYAGYLVISDTVKEDATEAVAAIKEQNIRTVMLTGDARENAEAVAERTGIDEVHAKLLPQDKVEKLQEIRQRQGSVMFVGDGINDAPVLASADVGAAMGSGADAAIEAADVVFMTSSMDAIPQALKIAQMTGKIAKQNVAFALAVKALVMILGLLGMANMWMAVFADTGVAMLCILNAIRILYKKD